MLKLNVSYLWSAPSWGQCDPLPPALPVTGNKCTASAHVWAFSGQLYLASTRPGFVSANGLPVWELSGNTCFHILGLTPFQLKGAVGWQGWGFKGVVTRPSQGLQRGGCLPKALVAVCYINPGFASTCPG